MFEQKHIGLLNARKSPNNSINYLNTKELFRLQNNSSSINNFASPSPSQNILNTPKNSLADFSFKLPTIIVPPRFQEKHKYEPLKLVPKTHVDAKAIKLIPVAYSSEFN